MSGTLRVESAEAEWDELLQAPLATPPGRVAIGRDILNRQGEEGCGAEVTSPFAADLRERFTESKEFSPRNLIFMRALAAIWNGQAIAKAPLAQLPWYHRIALIQKLSDPETRLWFGVAAAERGWSRNVLFHRIESKLNARAG